MKAYLRYVCQVCGWTSLPMGADAELPDACPRCDAVGEDLRMEVRLIVVQPSPEC